MPAKNGPKMEKLVVNAIRRLQDIQGSTSREISNYIAQEYDVPGRKINRQVQLALRRALSYGILQKSKDGSFTYNKDFLHNTTGEVTDMERCGPRYSRRRYGRSSRRRSRSKKRSRSRSKRRRSRRSRSRRRRSGRRSGRVRRRGEMESMTADAPRDGHHSRNGSPAPSDSGSSNQDFSEDPS